MDSLPKNPKLPGRAAKPGRWIQRPRNWRDGYSGQRILAKVNNVVYEFVADKPRPTKRGRSNMLTHVRSAEGKRRQNARRNARGKKRGCTKYNFKGAKLLHNVLDVGFVPNYWGRLEYHRRRYEKAGKAWVEPTRPPWGFRLLGDRKWQLPSIVALSLERIYARVQIVPNIGKPRSSSRRNPRNRSRADSLSIAEERLAKVLWSNKTYLREGEEARYESEKELALGRAYHSYWVENPDHWIESFLGGQTFRVEAPRAFQSKRVRTHRVLPW